MADPPFFPDAQVRALARAFTAADVPYAFGGAIALMYAAEPRGTVDIDINLFLPESAAGRVLALVAALGAQFDLAVARAEAFRTGQVRVRWGEVPIDLFFAYDPFHDSCADRVRVADAEGEPICVLSPEDLVVFKVLFDRGKDWVDIDQLLSVQRAAFDAPYVRDWLSRMLNPEDSRLIRLAELIEKYRQRSP